MNNTLKINVENDNLSPSEIIDIEEISENEIDEEIKITLFMSIRVSNIINILN